MSEQEKKPSDNQQPSPDRKPAKSTSQSKRGNNRGPQRPGGGRKAQGKGRTGPRRVSGGIRLRSTSGQSARNWWAQRWIRSMENVVDVNRLRRGRYYAQQGQVLSIDEDDGQIIAKVQGSRPKPYQVRISLKPFSEEEWANLLKVLSGKAIFSAELLNGHMPNNIEDAFAEAGVSLFPSRTGELLTDCTCPDWANPCKHVAATHYILGDRFDDDPFLIFRLRGYTQEQIINGLRKHRLGVDAVVTAADAGQPPQAGDIDTVEEDDDEAAMGQLPDVFDDEALDEFWQAPDDLADFPVRIQAPEVQFPIIKRLGEPDAAGRYSLSNLLGNTYMAVSQAAQIIAFMGSDLDDEEEDED
jgi:uncharacterized Zn finger protein